MPVRPEDEQKEGIGIQRSMFNKYKTYQLTELNYAHDITQGAAVCSRVAGSITEDWPWRNSTGAVCRRGG
jgi:hypothetical protein